MINMLTLALAPAICDANGDTGPLGGSADITGATTLHSYVHIVNIIRILAVLIIPSGMIIAILGCMQPGIGNGNQTGNLREPPPWNPERANTYSFQRWSREVLMWSIVCDMEPARKAAAVIMRLQGSAREFSQSLPIQQLIAGGDINGVRVDAMTWVMHMLSERYAPLGEEINIQAISEFMNFSGRANESVDDLLIRFDNVRQRAIEYGQLPLAQNVVAITWKLFEALRISDEQLITLLQPFQGRFPQNEQQFEDLRIRLRRMGHILERNPGNIASSFRTGRSQAQAFMTTANDINAQNGNGNASSGFRFGGNFPSGSASTPNEAGYEYVDSENGTDSETASSDGEGDYSDLIPAGLSETETAAQLFWSHTRAKSA